PRRVPDQAFPPSSRAGGGWGRSLGGGQLGGGWTWLLGSLAMSSRTRSSDNQPAQASAGDPVDDSADSHSDSRLPTTFGWAEVPGLLKVAMAVAVVGAALLAVGPFLDIV